MSDMANFCFIVMNRIEVGYQEILQGRGKNYGKSSAKQWNGRAHV